MNIYEFAKEKEKYSENYYRDLSEKCQNKGLKSIFSMLADEELKHFNMVKEMEQKGRPSIAETPILSDAKKIFQKMKDEKDIAGCGESQIDLYSDARKFEEESRDLYNKKAEEVDDEFQKNLFKKMAGEEQKHYNLMENIIQLVQRPERWLENAEWHHLEEY